MSKAYSYDPSPVAAKLGPRSPPCFESVMPSSYFGQADNASQEHYPNDAASVPSNLQAAPKKKYSCNICGRGFTTSGHLARHTRIHTGERNHACPFPGCETRCSRQDNLQQHYRIHLSPGSRRTTGKATRDAMNRAMEEFKRNASAQRSTQSVATASQSTRSPTVEAPQGDDIYSRPSLSSSPSARYPSPPDEPPRLECAYGPRASESVSSQSSTRSSPTLSSYDSSLHSASRPYNQLPYPIIQSHRSLSGKSDSHVSAQWQLRGNSGPDSPSYDDLPSPTGSAGYPYTDSDEASSPASSASGHQHSYSHHDSLTYDYYHNQSHSQHLSSANYPLSRDSSTYVDVSARGTTPQYSYASSSTVSPSTSQPSSPTYATSPIVPGNAYNNGRSVTAAFIHQDAASLQSSYGSTSLALAGCSPTEAQASRTHHNGVHGLASPGQAEPGAPLLQRHVSQLPVYDHATSARAKYSSAITTAQAAPQGDHSVRSDDGRQSMRRALSYTPVDHHHSHQTTVVHGEEALRTILRKTVVHDDRGHPRGDYDASERVPLPELATQFGHLQPSHQSHGSEHLSYGYGYPGMSADQQAWRADVLRPQAALVH